MSDSPLKKSCHHKVIGSVRNTRDGPSCMAVIYKSGQYKLHLNHGMKWILLRTLILEYTRAIAHFRLFRRAVSMDLYVNI